MTLSALAAAIRRGELSPREAVQDALERIERDDGALNSFITVRAEEALAEAEALPDRTGPLHGVPIGVKDVIDVAGTRATAAAAVGADNGAAADARGGARGGRGGGGVVGEVSTHEVAGGASATWEAVGSPRLHSSLHLCSQLGQWN